MDNLPVVVKEILESTELQKIKKVDLKNISIEVLIGTFNAIPYVGGVVASYLQIARSNRETYLEMEFYRKLLALIYGIKDLNLQPNDMKSFLVELENNAREFSAHPTKSVAELNQTPTIPDRKRTECPLPHAVGF